MRFRIFCLLLLSILAYASDGPGPRPTSVSASIYTGGAVPLVTQIVYSDGTTLKGDAAFVRGTLTFTVDSAADAVASLGYGKLGLATSGTSTVFYVGQASNFNSTDFALSQSAAGTTFINAKSNQTVTVATNGTNRLDITAASATFAVGVDVTVNSVTASTTAATGSLVVKGGAGIAGAEFVTGNITTAGVLVSTVATGTAPLTVTSTTNVANLNASSLSGATFAAPGAIGGGTASTGAFTSETATLDDAVTNTTSAVVTISHTTSGTAANSFGSQTLFKLEDDGGTNQNACAINVVWTTAASATRTAGFQFQCVSSAAALGNIFQINPSTVTVSSATFVAGGFSGITVSQTAASGGVRNCLTVTPAANLTVTSGTADPQVDFAFNRTQTWATTTPATTYEFLVRQPTYACNAVSQTITTAATVDIVGAPVNGTNVTITNKDALRIEAGWLEMVGTTGNSLRITTATANSTTACVLTATSGPAGAQTAVQGWLLINVAGTDRFIPFWAIQWLTAHWHEHELAWINGHRIHMTMAEYEDECTYMDAQ